MNSEEATNFQVSFFVNGETQAEVDDLWEKLSAGGAKEPCGWLRGGFSGSWQNQTPLGKDRSSAHSAILQQPRLGGQPLGAHDLEPEVRPAFEHPRSLAKGQRLDRHP